ncbi:MAG TPA: hypothetical protein VFJ16_07520 [Longimicrobium sp.]|nr:hypothetical protein [Longimicrobium sp.]
MTRHPSWDQPLADEIQVTAAPATPVADLARTEAAPVDDRPYEGAWAEYRAILRRIWITTAGGWLTIAALAWLLQQVGAEGVLSILFPIWGMVWFFTSAYSVVTLIAFACPRCGNTFFTPFSNPGFQYKCRSCGLRKFAVNDRPTRYIKYQ